MQELCIQQHTHLIIHFRQWLCTGIWLLLSSISTRSRCKWQKSFINNKYRGSALRVGKDIVWGVDNSFIWPHSIVASLCSAISSVDYGLQQGSIFALSSYVGHIVQLISTDCPGWNGTTAQPKTLMSPFEFISHICQKVGKVEVLVLYLFRTDHSDLAHKLRITCETYIIDGVQSTHRCFPVVLCVVWLSVIDNWGLTWHSIAAALFLPLLKTSHHPQERVWMAQWCLEGLLVLEMHSHQAGKDYLHTQVQELLNALLLFLDSTLFVTRWRQRLSKAQRFLKLRN